MALAVLVLVIAVINYVTMSTGHTVNRVKEIGLRKTLGAFNRSLRVQLVFESFSIVLVASIIGIAITFFAIPTFNQLVDGTILFEMQWLFYSNVIEKQDSII